MIVGLCLAFGFVWFILAWLHWRRHIRGLSEVKAVRARSRVHHIQEDNPLVTYSATRLARMIRERQVTSVEVVKLFIRRIEKVNGAINAMVHCRFEEALKEAERADSVAVDDPSRPLFCGVPTTIKEAFAVKGCPNTGGLLSRKGHMAQADADAVAAMRRAGFIVLGVTNISELCMWQESCNTVYGRCSNAYSAERTSGGSSGGEGALIGACGAPVGLGSDIGGSIRMPCFFNGIFGHKPTSRLVSNVGQFPIPSNLQSAANDFLCTGPMVRHAEDLAPLLSILSGGRAIVSLANVSTIRVFSCESIGIWGLRPSKELVEAQRSVERALRSAGCQVERVEPFAGMSAALEIWSTLLQEAEAQSFSERLYGPNPGFLRGLREFFWWTIGRSNHTLPAIGLALLEKITVLFATEKRIRQLQDGADALRTQVEELLGDQGVLLFPSFPTVAPKHSRALFFPIQWIYTAIFNTLLLPVTQIPLGLNKDGVPLGVQCIGRRGADALTISIAEHLERTGVAGWKLPLQ